MANPVKLWPPVFIWAGLIFWFSSIPDLKSGFEYDFLLRKIAHVSEYLVLTFLLYRAIKGSFSLNPLRLFIYPASLTFIYAISDEFHQSFVPGRSCCLSDVGIDAIGISLFYIFLISRRRKTSLKQ